ncbi:hypothetical protein VP242E401_P0015 [Vibrio phage 242E40-1]|nr:hypothetical protein VP242E401_P0015 [Vibrio phage 242E40-1]
MVTLCKQLGTHFPVHVLSIQSVMFFCSCGFMDY